MADFMHELIDQNIIQAVDKLEELYRSALAEMQDKLGELWKLIEDAPDPATALRIARKYNRLSLLTEQLAQQLSGVNSLAMAENFCLWATTYSQNYNFGGYLLEYVTDETKIFPVLNNKAVEAIVKGEVSPFTYVAFDELLDKNMIQDALTTQLVNGILAGETIDQLAKRIQKIGAVSKNRSTTIARTETNRLQNAGRYDAYTYGKEKWGLEILEMWVATKDSRTRDTHAELDGKVIALGKSFSSTDKDGGAITAKYPGDFGNAENDINCRCTTVPYFPDYEKIPSSVLSTQTAFETWEVERIEL